MQTVGDEVDATTRSVAVRVVVDNPGSMLKRQMYVQVKLEKQPAIQRTAAAGFRRFA